MMAVVMRVIMAMWMVMIMRMIMIVHMIYPVYMGMSLAAAIAHGKPPKS